jgi:hypothetical protein
MTDNDNDKDTAQPSATLQLERAEDFVSFYANHGFYQPSAWDLKIIFGQVDQVDGKDIVRQNVAITIPWAQAKLSLYYLRLHVAAMEIQSGKIPIRPDLIPAELPPLTPEQEAVPGAKELREAMKKLREEFIANL